MTFFELVLPFGQGKAAILPALDPAKRGAPFLNGVLASIPGRLHGSLRNLMVQLSFICFRSVQAYALDRAL
jgi:hypothetical protein